LEPVFSVHLHGTDSLFSSPKRNVFSPPLFPHFLDFSHPSSFFPPFFFTTKPSRIFSPPNPFGKEFRSWAVRCNSFRHFLSFDGRPLPSLFFFPPREGTPFFFNPKFSFNRFFFSPPPEGIPGPKAIPFFLFYSPFPGSLRFVRVFFGCMCSPKRGPFFPLCFLCETVFCFLADTPKALFLRIFPTSPLSLWHPPKVVTFFFEPKSVDLGPFLDKQYRCTNTPMDRSPSSSPPPLSTSAV